MTRKSWADGLWVWWLVRCMFWSALAVLLYLAVARPMPGGPTGALSIYDKLVHGSVYGALTLLGLFGRLRTSTVLLVLLSHGALVEVLQSLVPDRSADAWDMVADAIGIAMALVASRLGLRVLGASQQTG